jgi:L-ascorbate metabolism protein UlaG (beta-lactamase superfamily)
MNKAVVHYLFNSGFAVEAGNRVLIFDYYKTSPYKGKRGLEGGVITPDELRGRDVTVFASHAHMDHYTPEVLKWVKDIPDIRYILSHDIDAGKTENVIKAFPDASYEIGGMSIRTLKSTDEGVAFIVEAEGLKIYHAGDLNWWHWEGESDEENEAMGKAYRLEIDKLRGQTFDIAFVPVDPRLENQYLWGLDYFMKTADAKVIFPMHFFNGHSIFDRLLNDPMTKDYRDRIIRISRRGERFEV